MSPSGSIETSAIEYAFDGTTFQGYLALPGHAPGPVPGVLVAPEWWGLNAYSRSRADQLAYAGYAALAIDMYGEGRITADPTTASAWASTTRTGPVARERATRALQWLQEHPRVSGDRIAGVGFCFGGSVMLELARSGAALRGVASFHGSLATPLPARKGELRASVLVLHGADDPFISSDELQTFQTEMREAGADWRLCLLGNAVHSFSNPDADAAKIPGLAYNASAARRSWQTFENFLAEAFA